MDIRTGSNSPGCVFAYYYCYCAHTRRDKHSGNQSARWGRKHGR
jgi:hypothetical protein